MTADAIDRKRIFIAGAALFCLSSLLFCLTHNLLLSGVLRALQGLAAAMILASGSAALAQLYDGAQRTRAFSILGTVFGAGLAFGPLLIGFMTDAVGWRGVYALFALLSAMVLLIGLAYLPAAEKRAADTRQPRLTPVYAGPDAVYCIAHGHSGPRFLSLTTLALLIASGAVRGVCRALPEGEQPGAGHLPAASSAFCRRTVAACRHLLLLRCPADYCSPAFYGRRGDE
ncbi:MFS transporter [Klebsiella variicola subsp. variicola]|nr:MFS transporter [Klebsiella variicola subsp. variicola]